MVEMNQDEYIYKLMNWGCKKHLTLYYMYSSSLSYLRRCRGVLHRSPETRRGGAGRLKTCCRSQSAAAASHGRVGGGLGDWACVKSMTPWDILRRFRLGLSLCKKMDYF